MYSPTITRRFLEAQMAATPSFRAVYHSLADIQTMRGLLDEAYDPDEQQQTRALLPEEVAFIENERLVCTHDARYYYERYARIIDFETRELSPFTMNIAQEVVFDVWAEMELKRWAIMMLQLKARRLGVSTCSEIEVGRRLQFCPETAAIVASSTPDKSEALVKIMRDNLTHQPWWLMPKATKYRDFVPVEFAGHNATLSVQAGNQFAGMGRGATPSAVHLSEVCEWKDPVEDIDSSLLKAILEVPEVFFILESTALGKRNWYHKKWLSSKEGWPKGLSKLYPMFLPWFVGSDIYPTPTWLRKHPVPANWSPNVDIISRAERGRRYVEESPRLRKFMGSNWVMPREQMWYYECDRHQAVEEGTLARFLAEMASDDLEAFQSTHTSAFSQIVIQSHLARAKAPIAVYKLDGVGGSEDAIPDQIKADYTELDRSGKWPTLVIPCRWGQPANWCDFQLVPVRHEGGSASPILDRIFLYEAPRAFQTYGYGCDTSEGVGEDRGVIEMIRKDTLSEPDEQVCEFVSNGLSGVEMWPWCLALGTLYSTARHDGSVKQALSAIEVRAAGDNLQYQLRQRGWTNFMVWTRDLDSIRLDQGRARKLGFVTNAWSRPTAMTYLLTWLNRHWIQINSLELIDEMESFEKDEEKADRKMALRGAGGTHDDRLLALSFILFAFHLHEKIGGQMMSMEPDSARPADPVWDGADQCRAPNPDHPELGTSVRNRDILDRLYGGRRR